MSFGGPGGGQSSMKPIPPERGSFPIDHDGECKFVISDYLKCLRKVGGNNDEDCRKLAKKYLACRMDKNLMAPDNFQNLGLVFKEDEEHQQQQQQQQQPQGQQIKQGDSTPPTSQQPFDKPSR